jgi:ATP-binding cassette subfamily B (MDR/TAP) protein 1
MCIYHLYNPIMQMTRAASAATEMFAVIDSKLPDETGVKGERVSVTTEDIVFQNVTFAYPARPDTTILQSLSVVFKNGQTTAIVGPSGSGKSTIVGLLEKWYKPGKPSNSLPPSPNDGITADDFEKVSLTSSGIFIGGVSLDTIDAKWWRSNIGLVQQEPFLFNDTIYNNVANGLSGSLLERNTEHSKRLLVKNACKEAFADEFISKLPLGYDTVVGQAGMKLSGGQRQRIAIARAIIKNPSILILDEATSAIDVRTERIVQRALDRVSRSRTTIVIAHRLSTIRKADRIVVVRKGQVVEQGTHQELLRNETGVYSGLVKAQEVETGEEDEVSANDAIEDDAPIEKHETRTAKVSQEPSYKDKGFIASLGKLIMEHKEKWPLYCLVVLGACIGACEF